MRNTERRKVRVPAVAVAVEVLETRLDVAVAQGLGPDQEAAADGVRRLLRRARDAAYGVDPRPGPLNRWWSGTLVEAAYQNLHAARAQMVDVYDDAEIAAEIPAALARAQQALHRDDPRRLLSETIGRQGLVEQRSFLRRAIEDAYDALDRQHERLRSFRNIILLVALSIALLVTATVLTVSRQPSIMPLCFPANGLPATTTLLNCPTGTSVPAPDQLDIVVVALLGLLGGALAAAVSIRNLRGTSTPYDVPVALALLKVPLGAFTAVLGLVAIRGDFVPGLSALDSQQQILAYALVLGYAQQVFTFTLDRRAQTLLEGLPSKDPAQTPAAPSASAAVSAATALLAPHAPEPAALPSQASRSPEAAGPVAGSESESESVTLNGQDAPAPSYAPAPPVDADDVVQDDGRPVLPNVPVGDHR